MPKKAGPGLMATIKKAIGMNKKEETKPSPKRKPQNRNQQRRKPVHKNQSQNKNNPKPQNKNNENKAPNKPNHDKSAQQKKPIHTDKNKQPNSNKNIKPKEVTAEEVNGNLTTDNQKTVKAKIVDKKVEKKVEKKTEAKVEKKPEQKAEKKPEQKVEKTSGLKPVPTAKPKEKVVMPTRASNDPRYKS